MASPVLVTASSLTVVDLDVATVMMTPALAAHPMTNTSAKALAVMVLSLDDD